MFSPEEHIQTIHKLERGTPRLDALNTAIHEADAEAAHEWRLYFRYEYVEESIFHDDSYKAIIRFPELLAVFDEHPELEEDYCDDVMQAYKWVLENMQDYYQISRDEIERYYADYEKRCRKYGYALRVVHMKKSKFYLHIDKAEARAEFEAYRRLPRGTGSDCMACEADYDMEFMLNIGEEDEALRLAKPILDGQMRCSEVPHVTYGTLADHYLYKGDLEEAAYYGARCERMIGNESVFLDSMSTLLELYSAVNPSHGWKLFKQSIENFINCRNPFNRMCFARGAYRMLSVIIDLTENEEEQYSKSVLLRLLPVPADAERGTSLVALRDYFYDIAKEQSERLDRRNGTNDYMERLETKLKQADTITADEEQARPLHGLIQKCPTMLAVILPEGVQSSSMVEAERLRAAKLEGIELVSAEGGDDLHVVVRRDGRLFEVSVVLAEIHDQIRARPVSGLSDETFEQMLANPKKYLFTMELGASPMHDYALMMQLISVIFPDMVGMIDLLTQHAYPASWVKFAGRYPDAVTPSDVFGIYLTGSDDSDEVWITTLGMNTMGMRELEILGANRENFGIYADMLDNIAQQCVEHGILPDAGEIMATAYCGEEPYHFTWASAEQLAKEGSIASQMERDIPTGAVLVQKDDGNVLPPEAGLFDGDIDYPNSNASFYRRLRLAKAAFGIFAESVQRPVERAAARLEFRMDEAKKEEFGYSIELLWAEFSRCEDGRIYAQIAETSEALPEIHEGDEIEISAENVAAWFVKPEGWQAAVSETNAHILEEAVE